jgi:hypothetical protein
LLQNGTVGQGPQITMEEQLAPFMGAFEEGDELASVDTTEYADRKEKPFPASHPGRTLDGQSAGGDHAMHVRVVQ